MERPPAGGGRSRRHQTTEKRDQRKGTRYPGAGAGNAPRIQVPPTTEELIGTTGAGMVTGAGSPGRLGGRPRQKRRVASPDQEGRENTGAEGKPIQVNTGGSYISSDEVSRRRAGKGRFAL